MKALLVRLYRDENGFIVSAELILVATIAVLSMVVGLSEISNAVNQELEDVASAFGSVNQTYRYCGLDGCMGRWEGSFHEDTADDCDSDQDICATWPEAEYNWD